MAEAKTGHAQTTATGAGGKGLVEALVNGGGGGGAGSGGGGFGLGVGFALSPELAQKVRECRGVSSAPAVPESSLTFLKAAATATAAAAAAAAVPNGAPAANGVAVESSERAASSSSPDQQQQAIGGGGGGSEGGDASTASSELRLAETRGGAISAAAAAAAAAEPNGINTHGGSDCGGSGGDGGGDGGGGNLETLEGADQGRSQGGVGVGGVREGTSRRHEEKERAVLSDEAVPQEEEEEGAEAAAAATAAVADPPDSWEEFDETSVPPAAVAAVAVPRESSSVSKDTSGVADADDASASPSSFEPKPENIDRHGGHAEEKEGVGLQSAPVLLVDLARVCGFRVKGAEEAEVVGGKVRAALHESFAERSEELFEMGSAVHADTGSLAEELHRLSEASSIRSSWAVVDYPAKLGGPKADADADGGVDTSEAWAAVTAPSACRAVEAVRTALVGTNRHLVWKRDMLEQLEAVAVAEREAKEARVNQEREEELDAWRERRREQLERLIEVRPMFERRRAMAEEKLIAAGGASTAEDGRGDDGAAADPVSAAVVKSLDAKLESIDDLIARLEIEEGEEGYGFVPSDGDEDDDDDGYMYGDDDDEDEEDGQRHDGEENGGPDQHQQGPATGPQAAAGAGVGGGGGEEAAPAEGGAAADAAARERAKKKKKKKTGRPGVVEQLKAKASGGSADGAVNGAQGRGGGGGEGGDGTDASPPEMGLLDAVAAMILGRYPKDPRATSEQHFEKIATMHQQMKDAWLAEFGRLPPMAGSGSS